MRRWCRSIIMMADKIGNKKGKITKESKLTLLPKLNPNLKTKTTTKVVA